MKPFLLIYSIFLHSMHFQTSCITSTCTTGVISPCYVPCSKLVLSPQKTSEVVINWTFRCSCFAHQLTQSIQSLNSPGQSMYIMKHHFLTVATFVTLASQKYKHSELKKSSSRYLVHSFVNMAQSCCNHFDIPGHAWKSQEEPQNGHSLDV